MAKTPIPKITVPFKDVPKGLIIRIFGREFKDSNIRINIYIPSEKRFFYTDDLVLGTLCGFNTNVVEISNVIDMIEGRIVIYSKSNEDLSNIKISIFNDKNELIKHL